MNYIGKWVIDSIESFDVSDKVVFLTPEEFINAPMPAYINADDEEEVAHEKEQRQYVANAVLDVAEDNKIYVLVPLPESATQEEIDEAVKSGDVVLRDNMMVTEEFAWEDRDGELYYDTGIQGEVLGEKVDSWTKAINAEGMFAMIGTRYRKAE